MTKYDNLDSRIGSKERKNLVKIQGVKTSE